MAGEMACCAEEGGRGDSGSCSCVLMTVMCWVGLMLKKVIGCVKLELGGIWRQYSSD